MTRGIKNKCNDGFFSKDTLQSFYWAGFIAADGCVCLEKNKYPRLKICLAEKDKDHLTKFKRAIEFKGRVRTWCPEKHKPRSMISIASRQIFNDLARFNIVPRKTLGYAFPEWLITHPLVNHFMRGYFDGDGSFYLYRNRDSTIDNLAMNVCGTYEFLKIYKNILIGSEIKLSGNIYKSSSEKIYMLGCKGNRKTIKIRDFLYNNSTTGTRLERKFNIVYDKQFADMPKNLKTKGVIGCSKLDNSSISCDSIKDTAEHGFEPKSVSACCLGKRKSHKNYIWSFAGGR